MRQNLLAVAVVCSVLPLAAWGQTAIQSQEGITLQNEILQLQQQMQQLQTSNTGSGSALGGTSTPPSADTGPAGGGVVASLLTEVQQLQAQVQTLNGEVDTLQNQVNTQHDATEKEIGDLKFAMTNPAGTAPAGTLPPGTAPASAAHQGSAPGAAHHPAPGAPPAVAPVTGSASPKAELHAAQEAIIAGDYRTAEADARTILTTAKTSPQAYQAQFILAQSLYGQGKPQDAAIAFDDSYNHDRQGQYAPQSLLGLANSLTSIHQEAAACDTLASLNSQFPTPPAGLGPRIAAASRRAHCS
jgi:TolA-binding protein